jgi:hypothetical protein
MNPSLSLSPKIQVRRVFTGGEQHPLMIVDSVLDSPERMVHAARQASFYKPEHTNYPGLNAPLPLSYCHAVVGSLRGPIEAAFGLACSARLKYFGFFAVATLGAAQATAVQKIPHHDSPDPNRLALVHYFCDERFGGTGFFRHKQTGYESIDRVREQTYVPIARGELVDAEHADAFAGPGMAYYELIGQVGAVFNRLIVYRSHVLHSALLATTGASSDPASGRLTANGFIETIR